MKPVSVSPATLEDADALARDFQRGRTLLTAMELDIFTAVGTGPTSAETVAEQCRTDPRATGMLLRALVGLGLLTKTDSGFHCTDMGLRHLVRGAPDDARAPLLLGSRLWERWSGLTTAIRTGRPPSGPPRTPDDIRIFIGAMHRYALEQAPAFMRAIDLTKVGRVLDLGGGSGAYGIAFAEALPDAEVVVFDQPEILDVTRETLAAAGMAERIRVIAGDILTDDFGRDYDLIWLSNVVHAWGPEEVRTCLQRVRRALRPNGRLLLREFILNDDKTAPPFATIFALNMLVSTARGNCYSEREYRRWLTEAGFGDIRRITVPDAGHTAILEAIVPSGKEACSA